MTSTRREAIDPRRPTADPVLKTACRHLKSWELGARGLETFDASTTLKQSSHQEATAAATPGPTSGFPQGRADIGEQPSLLLPIDIGFTHVRSS